jgi:threonine dehydrogenase-like Zn-dependent dehydrogenase
MYSNVYDNHYLSTQTHGFLYYNQICVFSNSFHPLPDMYGKNLTFKTGGVDACDCAEILALIEEGKIDTTPLITHKYSLKDIDKAYELFENRQENVIKIAILNL